MISMRAKDSFYADDVKQVHARTTFQVASEARASELEKRGLASRLAGDEAEAPSAKAEQAPANKAEQAPTNKAEKSAGKKARKR